MHIVLIIPGTGVWYPRYFTNRTAPALDHCNFLFIPSFHRCLFTDKEEDKSTEELFPQDRVVR